MRWEVLGDGGELADVAAQRLLAALDADPALVLGLPTGRTPVELYRRVVAVCRPSPHCFRAATTFNLDEYVGLPPGHPGSYRAYMERHLLAHVDVEPAWAYVPEGSPEALRARWPELAFEDALHAECRRYEEAIHDAGGLGLTFLGLGVNGHIAFNEPGSAFRSRTRVVHLAEATRRANAAEFADGAVPERAITMGVGTILDSRAIVLLASGAGKAEAVARLRDGGVDEAFPASVLHGHPDVTVLLDRAAAGAVGRRDRLRRALRRRRPAPDGGAPRAQRA